MPRYGEWLKVRVDKGVSGITSTRKQIVGTMNVPDLPRYIQPRGPAEALPMLFQARTRPRSLYLCRGLGAIYRTPP